MALSVCVLCGYGQFTMQGTRPDFTSQAFLENLAKEVRRPTNQPPAPQQHAATRKC